MEQPWSPRGVDFAELLPLCSFKAQNRLCFLAGQAGVGRRGHSLGPPPPTVPLVLLVPLGISGERVTNCPKGQK